MYILAFESIHLFVCLLGFSVCPVQMWQSFERRLRVIF